MGKTGRRNRSYSAEFKINVIMDMREHRLGYGETARKYNFSDSGSSITPIQRWERIFLEEGSEGLMKERRGQANAAGGTRKGRPPKLDPQVEEDLIAENQRLRMEIEYIKTECLSSCGRAKEREKALIVSELRQRYPLKELLKLSGIARSTYYYHLKRLEVDKYVEEKASIIEVFERNKGICGYRRITDQLRKQGYTINHKTVLKLMKSLGLRGKQSKNGKYHSYNGQVSKIADNILKRIFTAEKPFEKLATDVSEFKVCNDKVYLSPVLDLFNREIISYSISLSPNL